MRNADRGRWRALKATRLVEQSRTSERSDVAKAAIEMLDKLHRAEATPAAKRQEILDGFVACLEAKEHAAVRHAGLRGDRRAGRAAAGAVPKLVGLDRTSERSDVAKAAIEVLGRIHRAKATPAATRQEILNGFVVCLDEAKEHAAVIHAGLRGDRRAGRRSRRSRAEARGAGPDEREV